MCDSVTTEVILDPNWTVGEILPVLELYDGAKIEARERIISADIDGCPNAETVILLVIPEAVDVSDVLTIICENVNDDDATYG